MNVTDFIGVAIFILGACIGSFLNVCIYRWPLEKSVRKPTRSFCPNCEKMIPWYDNIPFISFILLGGKCRFCKKKISFRYFFVELTTAITFLVFYLYFGLSPVLLPYLVMVSGFIVATFVDFGHRIIPDQVGIGGMWAGLVFSLGIPSLHQESVGAMTAGRIIMWIILAIIILSSLYQYFRGRNNQTPQENAEEDSKENMIILFVVLVFCAIDLIVGYFIKSGGDEPSQWLSLLRSLDSGIVGVMVGGGLIYVMGLLGEFLFKKEAMGGGDVKLMAMVGAFLGWQAALMTFFLAPFFGAAYGGVEWLRKKDTAIAYGPFLVLGALITLFWGDRIFFWILYRHDIF